MSDLVAAVAVGRLLAHRRRELGSALEQARSKRAAAMLAAHLDEVNVLHDQLAAAGLVAPRPAPGRASERDPFDPIAHLRCPGMPELGPARGLRRGGR